MEFSITTLNLLMVSLLHITLEDTGSSRLIEASSLKDMGSVDPVVGLTSHDMFAFGVGSIKLELPYWILDQGGHIKSVIVVVFNRRGTDTGRRTPREGRSELTPL